MGEAHALLYRGFNCNNSVHSRNVARVDSLDGNGQMIKSLVVSGACAGVLLGIAIGFPVAGLIAVHEAVQNGIITVDYARVHNPFVGLSLQQLAEYPINYRG